MPKAIVIKPDGTTRHVEIAATDSLPQLQEIVGGYIESIVGGSDWHLWINEEGKLRPDFQETYNGNATDLVRHNLIFGDAVFGTVIVIGDNSQGDDMDLPDYVLQKIKGFADTKWIDAAQEETDRSLAALQFDDVTEAE